jgi:hypothetical protein
MLEKFIDSKSGKILLILIPAIITYTVFLFYYINELKMDWFLEHWNYAVISILIALGVWIIRGAIKYDIDKKLKSNKLEIDEKNKELLDIIKLVFTISRNYFCRSIKEINPNSTEEQIKKTLNNESIFQYNNIPKNLAAFYSDKTKDDIKRLLDILYSDLLKDNDQDKQKLENKS